MPIQISHSHLTCMYYTDVCSSDSWHFKTPPLVSLQNDIREKQRRNSILMVCHYPDLGSASDWLCHMGKQKFGSTSQKQIWVVAHHQCGISVTVPQMSFHEETWRGSGNLCCFWFLSLRILLNADQCFLRCDLPCRRVNCYKGFIHWVHSSKVIHVLHKHMNY